MNFKTINSIHYVLRKNLQKYSDIVILYKSVFKLFTIRPNEALHVLVIPLFGGMGGGGGDEVVFNFSGTLGCVKLINCYNCLTLS